MADVSALGILYLLTKSIQIDCSYFILEEKAIPLNTCYHNSFGSYKYECGIDNDAIYRIDYTSNECIDNDMNKSIYRMSNIAQHSCNNINIPSCSSDKYAIIDTLHSITGIHEEKGIIINKCVSHSTPTGNISRYIHCNQENQIQTWIFDDGACTTFNSVVIHSLNDWYQDQNTVLKSISCPYCESNLISPDIEAAGGQPNIMINYVIVDDVNYAFPQPINICNGFINSISSYKYLCIHNNVYQAIWNNSNTCSGLYDIVRSLPNILDYNCLNYRTNLWHYSDIIQPSFITLLRQNTYTEDSIDNVYSIANTLEISYITNYCIRQNDDRFMIIECQKELMLIHYYYDDKCTQPISQCMSLWQSNSVCVGDTRTVDITQEEDVLLEIDTDITTTEDPVIDIACNYVHIHKYKEAVNRCNPYSLFGTKHSYKFVCSVDRFTNKRRIKKRKWKNKVECDKDGDTFDDEDDVNPEVLIDYKCDYKHVDVDIAEANCFENENYWQQTSIILNSCIKINDDKNSLYIRCYSAFTITYYYHNNDCTFFDRKEKWFGNKCESRYSEFLLDCNDIKHNISTQAPTNIPITNSPTITPLSLYSTLSPTSVTRVTSSDPAPNPTSIKTANPSSISAPNAVPNEISTTTLNHAQTSTLNPATNPTSNITPANPTINITPNPSSNITPNPAPNHAANPTINITPNPASNHAANTASNHANPASNHANPASIHTANPTLNLTPQPTTNPVTKPSSNPVTKPTSNPVTKPTSNPVTKPTSNPVMKPTINPIINPIINPTTNPASTLNPTLNTEPTPTSNPVNVPTSNPVPNPTSNPTQNTTPSESSFHPTSASALTSAPSLKRETVNTLHSTIVPHRNQDTTQHPTAVLDTTTISPLVTPTIMDANPTHKYSTIEPVISPISVTLTPTIDMQPTAQHPTLEPETVTMFPTEAAQALEIYLYFNETRSAHWSSSTQTKTEYGELIRRAVLLGLENTTAHSMNYEDRDLYTDKTWHAAGVTQWRNCYVFDEKLISVSFAYSICPSISSLNPYREGAQFAAVAELHVASDTNTTGFKEYIAQQLESKENIDYVQMALDGLVSKETLHQRRLLSTAQTIIISLDVLDPTKHMLDPATKRPSISTTIYKPTKPTYAKVTNNAFMDRVPLKYQGLFMDQPAVSGDIFIICVIVLMGMILLVGCCFWFKKNC